jgi:hypothetical protein
MLEEADVCILCGEVHPVRHFGIRHGERGECPKVIMGRFPLLSGPDSDELRIEEPIRVGASTQRIRDYETPTVRPAPRSDPADSVREPRPRSMGMAWLPPPDLGEAI